MLGCECGGHGITVARCSDSFAIVDSRRTPADRSFRTFQLSRIQDNASVSPNYQEVPTKKNNPKTNPPPTKAGPPAKRIR